MGPGKTGLNWFVCTNLKILRLSILHHHGTLSCLERTQKNRHIKQEMKTPSLGAECGWDTAWDYNDDDGESVNYVNIVTAYHCKFDFKYNHKTEEVLIFYYILNSIVISERDSERETR